MTQQYGDSDIVPAGGSVLPGTVGPASDIPGHGDGLTPDAGIGQTLVDT